MLRQQPVKMFHLSSGDPFVLCACLSTSMFVCICQHLCVSEGMGGYIHSAYVSFLLPRLETFSNVGRFELLSSFGWAA